MRFQLLIFDWDGTLADSAGHIIASMQVAIVALRLPPRADAQIAELIGLGLTEAMHRLYPELDTAELLRMIAVYRERTPMTSYVAPLFAQTAGTLSGLHGAGYRLAVATGKSRSSFDQSLQQHLPLKPLFVLTRCADETADKPNPRMLREILECTGVSAEAALMIGDTDYDMAMARAINMPAVGVACGVHDAGRLLRAGAVAVLDDVGVLPGWLQLRD